MDYLRRSALNGMTCLEKSSSIDRLKEGKPFSCEIDEDAVPTAKLGLGPRERHITKPFSLSYYTVVVGKIYRGKNLHDFHFAKGKGTLRHGS